MKFFYSLALAAIALSGCSSDNKAGNADASLLPPSNLVAERTGENEVLLTWKDNATAETGYAVLMRKIEQPTFEEVAQLGADATSYTFDGLLQEGENYFLGVKAFNAKEQTRVISTRFDMAVLADQPHATVSSVNSATNCIWATYSITNIAGQTGLEWGLCWSAEGTPTVNGAHIAGPKLDKDGKVFQVIPNTLLDYGTEYTVRAYVTTSIGTFYSSDYKASMTTDYPAITLDWKKVETADLPASITVFETTSKLNGDNFHAWYAIADLSAGDVEFRVNIPSEALTIDDQAKSFNGDCYIMVNGGYFYNGRNTGLAIVNGTPDGSINPVRGSLLLDSQPDEYNSMYNVTRGIFGVDANGKPAAYWAGSNSGKNYYFTTPIPAVKGENKYDEATANLPVKATSWNPKYALSAGPLLLIDGKIPFDFATTAMGGDYYLTNYELIAYDIFGKTVTPDRTAAGYTSDGKVILFICDGRIAASDGATLLELAQIMKGLGCVGAVNFDGGGSTGMMVGTKHVNDLTPNNRPVVSTMGFFKK